MTHILIPREPSTALLRPFIGCNTQELHEAWAAMVRIAEVQHARTGSQRPAQIEQPVTLAGTTIEQYARMFNAACEALGQVSDCLGINSDIDPGAEPIIAAIEQLRAGGAPVFDGCWKARMLDGRAIERDAQGLGEHPDLPWLDEGMNPPKFFEALGLQLVGVSAQDQLDVDAYDAMAGNYDSKDFNFAAWAPASPEGTGWCLVSIHDTEDGPVAWWLREQAYVAVTRPVRRAQERDDLTIEECREYLISGWARVRGRTEQALMLQLCEALEADASPAPVAGPAGSEIDWEVLPENPGERARFDRQLTQLYGGDPRVFISTSLRLWAETRGGGFFGAQCAVFANEVAKMHLAAPALEAPPGVAGRTTPRNDDERLRVDQALAMSEASSLAMSLFQKHYSSDPDYASGAVKFGLCDDLRGVISQIDNMSTGLARAELEARKPLPPDALADKCEAWLQAGGAANIVDAFEAGYRAAEET
ncbi:hypothetical protein [Delftia acidovorans]|uniref:hypothetical protein n=1 Tax=Delftia acidovorans TaxID=80866 RepID=UPI0033424080